MEALEAPESHFSPREGEKGKGVPDHKPEGPQAVRLQTCSRHILAARSREASVRWTWVSLTEFVTIL